MTDPTKSSSAIARLLELSSQHDIQAMDSLYRVVSPQLFGTLQAMLGNTELAAEALERTFTDIWNDGTAYRSDLGSPMSWLNHIARGHAADILRSQRRSSGSRWNAESVASDHLPDDSTSITGIRTLGLDTDNVSDAPNADVQTMIRGAFLQGTTVDELAQHFNTSADRIRNQIRRWMLGMREQING